MLRLLDFNSCSARNLWENTMKNLTLAAALVLSIFTAVAFVSAGEAPEATKGIIVGNVIDLTTYAMKGPGDDNIEAYKNRAVLGFPVGIVEEETGRVYVCVYRNPAPASGLQLANDILAPYMGMKVAAQGLKYHAKGINLFRLSIISEY